MELALITPDVGLPGRNGLETAPRLPDLTNAPILMITAFAQPSDELEGTAAGASAYQTEPFRLAQLRAIGLDLCPLVRTPALRLGPA
ncbi:response regulator [Arthrobacter sp. fls2-241-R2A-200]|uniref:response regulator n=1 Tax=unclassified Arthrobacter TaxID=235627 RepID=UPI003305E8D2